MPKFNAEIERFIDSYVTELSNGNAALFAGAGLSMPAGYVDWKTLLKPLAEEIGLDVEKEHDLLSVAQFHLNSKHNQRNVLNQTLIDNFGTAAAPTQAHLTIAKLPLQVIWTTNYDRLIERAFEQVGRIIDVKYAKNQLSTTLPGRELNLYKMHGDMERPDKTVITKDDYEKYYETHAEFLNALSGALTERTFLFVGFSFTDPNLDFVLGRIRARLENNQRRHFCLIKRRTKIAGESDEDFNYDCARQAHFISDLTRFNIETILVDAYAHVPEILDTIYNRLRARTIFIGGSAAEYGTWPQQDVFDMLRDLASALVDQGYKVITGFGLGVGEAVVTGAVERIQSRGLAMDKHLVMRPFPRSKPSDGKSIQEMYSQYRKEIIEPAGIFVSVFGNKEDAGKIVDANGLNEEISIALDSGLQVVPVGGTGYLSKTRWVEAMTNPSLFLHDDSASITDALQKLGEDYGSPSELIEPILDIIKQLSKGK